MGFLSIRDTQDEEDYFKDISSDNNSGHEDSENACSPYLFKTSGPEKKILPGIDVLPKKKIWASSMDLLCTADRDFPGETGGFRQYLPEAVTVRPSTTPPISPSIDLSIYPSPPGRGKHPKSQPRELSKLTWPWLRLPLPLRTVIL